MGSSGKASEGPSGTGTQLGMAGPLTAIELHFNGTSGAEEPSEYVTLLRMFFFLPIIVFHFCFGTPGPSLWAPFCPKLLCLGKFFQEFSFQGL